MKQLSILLSPLLLLGFAFVSRAQVREMRPVEVELYLGLNGGYRSFNGEIPVGTLDLGLECRYNFKNVPLNVGLQTGWFPMQYDSWTNPDYGGWFFGPVAEYSWPRGRKFQLICSLGGGVIFAGNGPHRTAPYCRPKVALEIHNHFRIYFASMASVNHNSGWAVGVAAVIGGGPRKRASE